MSRVSNQWNNLVQGKNLGSVPQSMREQHKEHIADAITEEKNSLEGPEEIISDESLFATQLQSVQDAPYLKTLLRDIPDHIHFPMDKARKDRFYPDGYSIHYFDIIESFILKDGIEGKLLGQLFFHKDDTDGPFYYYVFESYSDESDPKSLYDGKVFYLITKDQFERLKLRKI